MNTREPMDEYWDALVESEAMIALPLGSVERRPERPWPSQPAENA